MKLQKAMNALFMDAMVIIYLKYHQIATVMYHLHAIIVQMNILSALYVMFVELQRVIL